MVAGKRMPTCLRPARTPAEFTHTGFLIEVSWTEWLSDDPKGRLQRIRSYFRESPHLFDSRARWTRGNGRLEARQIVCFSRGRELHVSIASVLHPPGESKLTRLVHDVPPEANTLNSSPHLEMDAIHFGAIA
jgi:hypothetical protein